MAGDHQSGDRRSWPLTIPRKNLFEEKRNFEAEDASDIPSIFHIDRTSELTDPERVSLHQRLSGCGKLGRVHPRGYGGGFTIAGRLDTYTGQWTGPSPAVMADCGLVKVTAARPLTNWAQCYCCEVTFRNLTADVCVWTLHRQLSPNCRHLRKHVRRAHDSKAGNVRLMVRRLSTDIGFGER